MEPTEARCPRCGSDDVRRVVHGYPDPDDVERHRGQVDFAGCLVPPDPPAFRCARCRTAWGSAGRGGEGGSGAH